MDFRLRPGWMQRFHYYNGIVSSDVLSFCMYIHILCISAGNVVAAVRVDKFADIEHLPGMEEKIATVLSAAQVMDLVFGQTAIAPDGQQDSFVITAVLDAVGSGADFKHLRWPPFRQTDHQLEINSKGKCSAAWTP